MLTEGPTPKEAAVTSPHFAYLKDLAERKIVHDDPAVREGNMYAELFLYRMALLAQPIPEIG